jgi:hypothetical protein
MNKLIAHLVTTAILTGGLGAIAAPLQADTGHGHDGDPSPAETRPHSGEHDDPHEHGMLAVSEDQPIPTVVVEIFPDPVAGWNLWVQTENWEFAPERVNETSVTTEGHAHLYVNGEKITRLYSGRCIMKV